MAKKKNKNLRDDVSRDNLPDISTTKPADDKPKKDKGQGKKGDKKHEQVAPPAAATLLCETIASQIENFLAHDPEDRKNALDGLFTLGGRWPAGITGCDDALRIRLSARPVWTAMTIPRCAGCPRLLL